MVGKFYTTRGRWSNSHFASLLPADEQSGDAHQHGNEKHACADALDHATHRLCVTEKKLVKNRRGAACCMKETLKQSLGSPALVNTGSDKKVSVKRGGASMRVTSLLSSSNSWVKARMLSLQIKQDTKLEWNAFLIPEFRHETTSATVHCNNLQATSVISA